MLFARRYTKSDFQKWNSFVEVHVPNMFFFNRRFMEYHSSRFEDFSILFFKDEELVAILPASRSAHTLECHGGLTYGWMMSKLGRYQDTKELFDSLIDFLKSAEISKLVYKKAPRPFCETSGDDDLYELMRRGAVLDRRDLTTIVNLKDYSFSTGRSYSIKKAAKLNLNIENGASRLPEFYALLSTVLSERHDAAPVHTIEELQMLMSVFPKNIHLYSVISNQVLVAGAIIFKFGNVLHTQYLSSSISGRSLGALDYLIGFLIEQAQNESQYFSFGISTVDRGRSVNSGLVFQKEGFGGKNYCVDQYVLVV